MVPLYSVCQAVFREQGFQAFRLVDWGGVGCGKGEISRGILGKNCWRHSGEGGVIVFGGGFLGDGFWLCGGVLVVSRLFWP